MFSSASVSVKQINKLVTSPWSLESFINTIHKKTLNVSQCFYSALKDKIVFQHVEQSKEQTPL